MPNLYFFKYFATFLFISLIIGLKSNAQNKGSFDIRIHQIEYIDAESEQLTYLDSESLVKELRLSRNYNHVYVELEHNPDTQYSFKVTGGAGLGDWEKSTNEIHLVGLSRGEHQLYIRGESNGLTSNLQQFKIYISSPYYLKWWFISLIIVLVIGVFYMFLVLEAKLLKERKDRNLQVSNLEARAYRAQMNPHFIFNALNGIQTAKILGGEKEFNNYITSFSKLIRNTIEMSSVDRISVTEEAKYITNYIELQALRLEEKIDLEFKIDPSIDQNEVYLPCMMLQPIVENSIVHGIIPKGKSGKITIDLIREGEMLRICITDNGIGRVAAAKERKKYANHKSFATKIMRDRIDIFNYYNDKKLSFTIEDLYQDDGNAAGTKVTLLVPIDLKTRN
ncbi:MAG: histidine kinase [Bacteroidetes bacterium]|nr:histidine kinase [Bacteroidota bacterium]MDA0889051.1 histidine kinase [Bacteroidota bacterium]MDA1084946.1 histidine kinase [Bacteroidota bacterium]